MLVLPVPPVTVVVGIVAAIALAAGEARRAVGGEVDRRRSRLVPPVDRGGDGDKRAVAAVPLKLILEREDVVASIEAAEVCCCCCC